MKHIIFFYWEVTQQVQIPTIDKEDVNLYFVRKFHKNVKHCNVKMWVFKNTPGICSFIFRKRVSHLFLKWEEVVYFLGAIFSID